jgi:hypothetical protein
MLTGAVLAGGACCISLFIDKLVCTFYPSMQPSNSMSPLLPIARTSLLNTITTQVAPFPSTASEMQALFMVQ